MKEIQKMMEEGVEKMRWMLVWMSRSPWHLLLLHVVLLQTCNAIKNNFFLLSFLFLKTTRVPQRGFHLNFLPWAPPREVLTQRSYSFPFFSLLKSLDHLKRGFQPNDGTQVPHGGFQLSPYFFLFFLQWVGEVEAKTCSTTITILFKSSTNSCLKRDFLYTFN